VSTVAAASATVAVSTRRTAIVVDSQPLWIEALERVLLGTGVDVVGSASTLDEALRLIDEAHPHLLIGELNRSSNTTDAAEWLRAVREARPDLTAIVVSSLQEPEDVEAAFSAGAAAYVFKTAEAGDVALAIRQTYENSIFFARSTSFGRSVPVRSNGNGHSHDLTRRELEILRLVAEGHTNRAIARMLWVTEQTVKFHLSNIYRKIHVSNRTEASRWAQMNDLLPTTTAA
jgi:DNA-binding NarL/FixJ family response regulator